MDAVRSKQQAERRLSVMRAATGRTPETVATDSVRSLAMVFAAIESAETHRRVSIASLLGAA